MHAERNGRGRRRGTLASNHSHWPILRRFSLRQGDSQLSSPITFDSFFNETSKRIVLDAGDVLPLENLLMCFSAKLAVADIVEAA